MTRSSQGARPEQDERFRSLVQNARDGIMIVDPDGRITYVTPSVERISGYSPEELVGNVGFHFVAPESFDSAIDTFQRVAETPGACELVELEFVHKDGHRVWIEVTLTNLVEDPHVQGLVSNFHDITDRKLAEAQLRELEYKYRSLVEDLPAIVYISELGEEGRWHYVSPQVESMLGVPADEWMSNPRSWFDAIHPDDRSRVMRDEFLAVDLQAGETIVSEYRLLRPDVSEIWVRDEFRLLSGADEYPRLVRGVITDITGAKEAERLAEQLRQSQKMEAIGQLAGGVAHDFNNLLFVIENSARFVADELPHGDPKRADAEQIIRAGERASALVRQLLAFSRKDMVTPEVLDLNEIVYEVGKLLHRTIGENIEFETKLCSALPLVAIDRVQLEQVILNLAVNAKDAMPGGGRLLIETSLGASENREVCLTVSDSGHGMSDEVRERVFEPFFTTRPRGEGTGLGLSTVFGIVHASGGRLSVDSRPGHGSVFRVFLPANNGRSPVAPAPESPKEIRGVCKTILVAEDEDGVRNLVHRILSRHGYEVMVAESGPDALELARRHGDRIDLLLTDVIMPHMSGKELSTRLNETERSIPTLYMSGYTDQIITREGMLSGAEDLITKPFTPEELLSTIEKVLSAHRT